MQKTDLFSFNTNIFGYGYINNTRIEKDEMSEMSKKTKTYKAIVKIFKYNFFNPDHIMIGILNGNNSSKTNLNMIIKKLSNNFYLSNMPKEYLVIPTLSVLRRNVEEVNISAC